MALGGRKPGWFERILGGPEQPRPDAPPAPLPASASEGRPDFTPAAEAVPVAPVEPTVTEASPETPPDAKPVPELRGATLQPVADRPGVDAPETLPSPRTPVPPPTARPEPPPIPLASAAPPPVPPPLPSGQPPVVAEPEPASWFGRLAHGMRRTSTAIGDGVTGLFTKRKLDAAAVEELEDLLIGADLGVECTTRIVRAVSAGRYDREISPDEVRTIMAREIETVLAPAIRPLALQSARKPFVLLMIGVNGAGKTTTIGKIASKFRQHLLKVTIVAGDTFRAAATEQLKVWGERVGAPVISREPGADAAGLAFDALKAAGQDGTDVLLIDTAGRLQNKAGLMAELEKIIRVVKKVDPDAPHATLLVLDATVGQNAISQVELFGRTAGVTGLVMTKLDGTARGGILVALAAKFGLPIHFIGVGESVEDLEPFAARDFARAIAGLGAE